MNSKEFVLWLKGFVEGVHDFNIIPKQWDYLKQKLSEVKDEEPIGFPFGTPNTAPIQTLPFIQPYNPHNPYIINCGSGSSGTTITTTPGTGFITTSNPATFGTGSVLTYNPSSTTYVNPQSGSWHYTNSTWKPEHGPDSPTIQNINESFGESLEELENDFFGIIDNIKKEPHNED